MVFVRVCEVYIQTSLEHLEGKVEVLPTTHHRERRVAQGVLPPPNAWGQGDTLGP